MGSHRVLSLLIALLVPAVITVAPAEARTTTSADVRVTAADTASDTDGDGLDDASDGCPGVASANPTGCPTVTRSARLRYLSGDSVLQARVLSPATACSARSRVKLWRVMPGGALRVQVETSTSSGLRRFRAPRGATYFVTVSSSYAPGIAECAEARSSKVALPRLQ
ncbi:MAG: hypothetical protein LH477_15700 [Nocardioides sp.]|nr:hypothetical protein [Nocardioides sp.]